MQIRSLYCPCNERTDNPLDHYEREDCGAVAPGRPERWPLECLLAILEGAQSDKYHSGGRLTATRILGCPRETMILDNKAIVYDVRNGGAAFFGTLMHERMARLARPGAYKEIVIPPFEFGGYQLEGKTDRVKGDFSEIKDWKGHSEQTQNFKYKRFMEGKVDHEGAAQLNIYRIGIAKSVLHIDPAEYRPRLVLVHGANVSWGSPPWFEAEQPIMSEEEILAMRPFDDDENPMTQPYTVRELMEQHIEAQKRIDSIKASGLTESAKAREIDNIIADMPMVGRNVFVWKYNRKTRRREKLPCGDKCTKYCAAVRDCFALEQTKGVPAGIATPRAPSGVDIMSLIMGGSDDD